MRPRIVASPDRAASRGAPRPPADLAEADCLRLAVAGRSDLRRTGDAAVAVRGPVTSSSALAVRALAPSGLGPAMLPDWLIDQDLREGRPAELFPADAAQGAGEPGAVRAARPAGRHVPGKTRAAVAIFMARLPRSQPPGSAS